MVSYNDHKLACGPVQCLHCRYCHIYKKEILKRRRQSTASCSVTECELTLRIRLTPPPQKTAKSIKYPCATAFDEDVAFFRRPELHLAEKRDIHIQPCRMFAKCQLLPESGIWFPEKVDTL